MNTQRLCAREVAQGLRQKAINRVLYLVAVEKGKETEARFFAAMQSAPKKVMPPWIVSIRQASCHEDRKGIDAVVRTKDVGDLLLQIKSSQAGANNFVKGYQARRAKYIGVIVIREFHSLEDIYKIARKVISGLRQKKLNKSWGDQVG